MSETGSSATRRVILLAGVWDQLSPLCPLARSLAARGHSLVLWDARPEAATPAARRSVLDLQLELERAGGISLAVTGPGLHGAAEAFGRIELAVAPDLAAVARVAEAAAGLERPRRPDRLIVLAAPPPPESAPLSLPAGLRLIFTELAPDSSPEDLINAHLS